MNFSVKNLLMVGVVFFGAPFFGTLQSEIIYRLAELSDIDALLAHYQVIEITPEDRQNLVVYPIEVRREVLEASIEKKRFYVAVDHPSQTIIGFIKLFVIDDSEEREDILRNEVCCIGDKAECVSQVMQCIVKHNISEHQLGSAYPTNDVYRYSDNYLYLYYGGAYTVLDFRKKYICSNLISYALQDCYEKIKQKKFAGLAMVYGQARAASEQRFMIKQFTQFVAKNFCPYSPIMSFYHYRFRAFKPELIFEDEKIKVSLPADQINHDYGNVLVCEISFD